MSFVDVGLLRRELDMLAPEIHLLAEESRARRRLAEIEVAKLELAQKLRKHKGKSKQAVEA